MKTIVVFATNNQNKVSEVQSLLPVSLNVKSLKDMGIEEEIPEPYETIEENSRHKCIFIHKKYGYVCFSEDTGLEVEALNGEPGVRSARYASEEPTYLDNIDKLLQKMQLHENKEARFRTVATLILDGKVKQFEGVCNGNIILERKGNGGFGYDPVFMPIGANKTFAEMDIGEKNQFSHRKIAINKLLDYLKNHV